LLGKAPPSSCKANNKINSCNVPRLCVKTDTGTSDPPSAGWILKVKRAGCADAMETDPEALCWPWQRRAWTVRAFFGWSTGMEGSKEVRLLFGQLPHCAGDGMGPLVCCGGSALNERQVWTQAHGVTQSELPAD
jgi:hypothetical protein